MKIKSLNEFLKLYPSVLRISVKWGDMDAFKHVNNTMYFRYQEASRGMFMTQVLNMIQDENFNKNEWLSGRGIGPILSNTHCTFKFPVSYPDNLIVGSTIKKEDLHTDRSKVTHGIWSLRHKRFVAEGYGTIVTYDFKNAKVVNTPQIIQNAVEEFIQKDSLHLLNEFEQIVDFQSEF